MISNIPSLSIDEVPFLVPRRWNVDRQFVGECVLVAHSTECWEAGTSLHSHDQAKTYISMIETVGFYFNYEFIVRDR